MLYKLKAIKSNIDGQTKSIRKQKKFARSMCTHRVFVYTEQWTEFQNWKQKFMQTILKMNAPPFTLQSNFDGT